MTNIHPVSQAIFFLLASFLLLSSLKMRKMKWVLSAFYGIAAILSFSGLTSWASYFGGPGTLGPAMAAWDLVPPSLYYQISVSSRAHFVSRSPTPPHAFHTHEHLLMRCGINVIRSRVRGYYACSARIARARAYAGNTASVMYPHWSYARAI